MRSLRSFCYRPALRLCAAVSAPAAPSLQQQRRYVSNAPPTSPPTAPPAAAATAAKADVPAPAKKDGPPSVEPLVNELRTLITRSVPIGDVFKGLSPASRKILVAHKLPLEELLLHLPNHFTLLRVGVGPASLRSTLLVAPPSAVKSNANILQLPANARPLPALVQWLGEERAKEVSTARHSVASRSEVPKLGTGFVDGYSSFKERIEELLTYVPDDYAPFNSLDIPTDVKMRCMGYPSVRPAAFLLKYPQFFEVRVQDRTKNSFLVRRSPVLQQRLRMQDKP